MVNAALKEISLKYDDLGDMHPAAYESLDAALKEAYDLGLVDRGKNLTSEKISIFEVTEEIKSGGEWLGAARRWIQENIRHGDTDTLMWNSAEPVPVPFCKLQELAQTVAAAAIVEECNKQKKACR